VPRQMLVTSRTGTQVLKESLAHNEAQLQGVLRDHPGLLPLEDLGLVGPALVVGKETGVPSGAVDLVLVARGGELVIVEFKTGPQNPDFRAALAQLLDYGSDLWQISLDEFERTVPLRYFASSQAAGTGYEKVKSLDEAIVKAWGDDPLSEEELATFKDRLTADLADGSFAYVVAAQRLTDAMVTTARYLNATHQRSRFYLVEVVRFTDGLPEGEEVFEARTVLKPDPTSRGGSRGPRGARLTRDNLIDQIEDADYAEGIGELLDTAEATALVIAWGTSGVSLRLPNPLGGPPASIGWIHPPGVVGWLGLTDLVLGFDPTSPAYEPLRAWLDAYVERISSLGGDPVGNGGLTAFHFSPPMTCAHIDDITQALEGLARAALA
jgi:hypothetical protein